jgi:colicin import membrane protein
MKNIKNILSLILILGLIILPNTNALAQPEKNKPDKTKAKEKTEAKKVEDMSNKGTPKLQEKEVGKDHPSKQHKDKDSIELKGGPHDTRGPGEKPEPPKDGMKKGEKKELPKDSAKHDMEKEKQGHAYGKNKGELEGKEFGQSRAEQAKMQQNIKEQELGTSVAEGEAKVIEAREKINAAKEKLEKDKKAKKISDAEYKEKKEKIDKAEQAVNDLEMDVQKGKEMENK